MAATGGSKPDKSTVIPIPERDAVRWLADHGDALFRFAMSRLGDPDAAEELVQATLTAAWESRDRFDGRSSRRTWLIGILRHKVLDHLRDRARQRGDVPLDAERVEPIFTAGGHWRRTLGRWPADPSEPLQRREFWRVFDECRAHLPAPLAEAFVLREIEGLSVATACKRTGLSPTNLSVRVHRARLLLRECLERRWFSDPERHRRA